MAVVHLCAHSTHYASLLRIIHHVGQYVIGEWHEELTSDEFAFALFPVSAFSTPGTIVSRRATVADGTYLV